MLVEIGLVVEILVVEMGSVVEIASLVGLGLSFEFNSCVVSWLSAGRGSVKLLL